ncbi:helix-turn-helix domain-containing protein [Streptomyces misionensis]|uniref:Helix-turn-helix domain-containing protein n=1 Tax=Streptomyces misionensis TaxID=67331 RepID=A0A5C6JVH5_9ACTN|nr:helix-turn-helix domain-containing protein [Streptomyces misionensis]TWV50244.1 helix-turn-helix domain-containing protein [Streptomyces misionensis]TWV51466.1 helix-turn-helix domain-containing protein [Streptomyces misionensis]
MTTRRTESIDPRATLRGGLPDRYLTPEDLVTMFSLPSVETVYAWRRKRIGPPGFRVGKHLRYDPATVRAWVNEQSALEDAA